MNEKQSMLHHVAARYISGLDVEIKINGNELQLESLKNLLDTSKSLKEELDRSNPDIEKVSNLVKLKKEHTLRFQNLTGVEWHL